MSASPTCPRCGRDVPADAAFCPYCAQRLGETTEVQRPPAERVRVFGATPAGALLVVAAAALGASVALLGLGRLVAAGVGLVVAALFAATGARLLVRDRRSPLGRRAATAAERGRGRLELLRTGAEARRRSARLRAERERLVVERRTRLLALGEAVYADDVQATSRVRTELDELDAVIRAKEDELHTVTAEAHERVERTRFETEPTRVVPAAVTPEPYPPPGEADPPEPARVPEPYPPPGEADPPEPARVPEPSPDPGEADLPEPTRIPEPGAGERADERPR